MIQLFQPLRLSSQFRASKKKKKKKEQVKWSLLLTAGFPIFIFFFRSHENLSKVKFHTRKRPPSMIFTRRIQLKTIAGNRKKRRICYCQEFLYWTVADCVQQMFKIKYTPLRSDATLITGVFQTLAASNLFLLIYSHSQSCVRSMSRTVDKQDLESGPRNTLRCHRSVLWDLHLIYTSTWQLQLLT